VGRAARARRGLKIALYRRRNGRGSTLFRRSEGILEACAGTEPHGAAPFHFPRPEPHGAAPFNSLGPEPRKGALRSTPSVRSRGRGRLRSTPHFSKPRGPILTMKVVSLPPLRDHFSVAAELRRTPTALSCELLDFSTSIAPPAREPRGTSAADPGSSPSRSRRASAASSRPTRAAQQIASAEPHPRVEYRCAPRAESSGLPDACADLVVAAQAAHWFDRRRFYAEARRVARPDAPRSRSRPTPAPRAEGRRHRDRPLLQRPDSVPFWPPERRHTEDGYRSMPFPFEELVAAAARDPRRVGPRGLPRLRRDLSAVLALQRAEGRGGIEAFRHAIAAGVGAVNTVRTIRWHAFGARWKALTNLAQLAVQESGWTGPSRTRGSRTTPRHVASQGEPAPGLPTKLSASGPALVARTRSPGFQGWSWPKAGPGRSLEDCVATHRVSLAARKNRSSPADRAQRSEASFPEEIRGGVVGNGDRAAARGGRMGSVARSTGGESVRKLNLFV
jgi:hypothetical protein